MRWWVLALALGVVGCGGSSSRRTSSPDTWSAHPPTQHVTCGAALPMCADAASLRVRWPDGARAPAAVHAAIDRDALDPVELEIGACAPVGTHALSIDGAATQTIEILPGAETRVALSALPGGGLGAETTLGDVDTIALVASLATTSLPSIGSEATPEERRLYTPTLAAAFDGFRSRLARVTDIAQRVGDALLRTASQDHEQRAQSIALQLDEVRPSADRLAAIRRAMASEIAAAGAMIAIERSCPLYADGDPAPTLAPITVEARPYVGSTTSVVRMRVAVDDVEVLDTGAASAAELFDRTIADGVVPPGEHVIVAEVTFADRGGIHPRRPVLPTSTITIARTGTRIVVRARGDGTVEITQP